MTSKPISQRLKEVQDFFSAPETPNQLAWGYAHMINHWLLTRDKSVKEEITPETTLGEVAEIAHRIGLDGDVTGWDKGARE